MKKRKLGKTNSLIIIFIILVGIYIIFGISRGLYQSMIRNNKDRVNIVFYGPHPSILSLGYTDGVNYIGFFDQGSEVYVPGGYGRYKLGGLGRLVDIEKKPEILQKTFSSVISSYVDFYFYPKKSQIYSFDEPDNARREFFIPRLSILDVFFPHNFGSNTSLFDRLHIFITLFDKKRSDFSKLKIKSVTDETGSRIFMESQFDKKYQGYFYEKKLRDEGKSVQILYTNYKSATIVTRIIEGEGIRVADLSQNSHPHNVHCVLQENTDKPSQSAFFLQNIFACKLAKKVVEDAAFVLRLGDSLEKEWE